MDYFIKIKPKNDYRTYSKYAFSKLSVKEKGRIVSQVFTIVAGGYVKCFYGENNLRFTVYENIPQLGNILGKFETLQDATNFIDSIDSLK